jgi:hypothetical protein
VSATRLILIEGMIGAGKTTTASWLEDWLSRRGEDARAYCEVAADHPVRTRAVDELRAAARDDGQLDGAGNGTTGEPGGYAVSQWRALAVRCVRGRQTVILESTFLQNSVMPAFIDGAPADTVTALFTTIVRQVGPAAPFLVYLRPTDITAAITRTHDTRGQPWSGRNLAFVDNCPWARRRNLRGLGAVIALYQAWEAVVDLLFGQYPFGKLMLTDPQHDWPAALTRIGAAIRP